MGEVRSSLIHCRRWHSFHHHHLYDGVVDSHLNLSGSFRGREGLRHRQGNELSGWTPHFLSILLTATRERNTSDEKELFEMEESVSTGTNSYKKAMNKFSLEIKRRLGHVRMGSYDMTDFNEGKVGFDRVRRSLPILGYTLSSPTTSKVEPRQPCCLSEKA